MRCYIGLLVFLATLRFISGLTDVTLTVHDQIDGLKQEIRNKIYLKRTPVNNHYGIHKHSAERDNDLEYYEYVEERLGPSLQPVLEADEHRKESKAFMPLLKTTAEPDPERQMPVLRREMLNDTGYSAHTTVSAVDARRNFYFYFPELRDQELYWVHSRVLITPFLTGKKTDHKFQEYFEVDLKDHTFLRFMQLLHINTTGHDISDIRTILVQISNLKLRLFLWGTDAIKILLNELIEGPVHTFLELKKGIKKLFKQWHLDTSAVEVLLKESRIFRPPCINWRPGGSTKLKTRKTFTPPMPPRTPKICEHSDDESCEFRGGQKLHVAKQNRTKFILREAVATTDAQAPPALPDDAEETKPTSVRGDEEDAYEGGERIMFEWLHSGVEKKKGRKDHKRHQHKARG